MALRTGDEIRGLSLCSGIGGIDLGLQLALGRRYRIVGYVEREAFASAVLVDRMEAKALDPAPVWDDLETSDGSAYCGRVDIVSAGFPCQPVSCAGRKRGYEDERWLWDEIVRIVGEVRPTWLFLENVPGLLSATGGYCLCGWVDRRGRLHRHFSFGEEVLQSAGGRWNGGAGVTDFESPSLDIRRVAGSVEGGDRKVGGGLSLDSVRERCKGFLAVHQTVLEAQERAVLDCREKYDRWYGQGADPRTEPQRPPPGRGLVCPACGRKMEGPADLDRVFSGVLGSLADLGFDAEWEVLSAADVGAPHLRKRVWILASHPDRKALANPAGDPGRPPSRWERGLAGARCGKVADAEDADRRLGIEELEAKARKRWRRLGGSFPPPPVRIDDELGPWEQWFRGEYDEWRRWLERNPGSEPAVCRDADGLPFRMDELSALGNAVVPLCAAAAFLRLRERFDA